MNYRMLGYLLGVILMLEAVLMAVPTVVAVIYGESPLPFLITIAIAAAISLPFVLLKPKNSRIFAKEGFVCVAAAWILLSAVGALPFVFSGAIPNYVDAFFETVSGFTTTGASILSAVEGLPRGILFWRSFTHWIGGMGVLLFVLAVLPSAGGQGIHLMRAESPGPIKGKLVPKMRQTALILYGIYFALSVIMVIALLLCGLPIYDALVNTFATAGTGGFSVLNNSIAGYANPAAEWVIAVFMLIFGINFNLYYFLLLRRFRDVIRDEELRVYLIVCAVATALIALNVCHLFASASDTLRASFFQVTTIISTAGFATADYNLWPEFSKTVLILLMILGSCAGSTAGGLKISRVLLLVKGIFREIRHILRPRSINVVRLNGEAVPDEVSRSALGYLTLYICIAASTVLLLSIDGFNLETNFTAMLACLNNVGPGLGEVGPTGNFGAYSIFSKLLLAGNMLLGRLEIFPMLILFSPHTWKKR